jgi:hypothetical protein
LEVAAQRLEGVALLLDFPLCTEPKVAEKGNGWTPALQGMLEQDAGDDGGQDEEAAIDERAQGRQGVITIGVPAYRDSEEVTLPKTLALPFEEQRPTWQFPWDGKPEHHGVTMLT